MSLSLGEHGRVPIGSGGMWRYTSDVTNPTSGFLSLVVLLPPKILLFSMSAAVERNCWFRLVDYCFAVITGSCSMLEV